MICPCRLDKVYDVKKLGDMIVIVGEREVYPECYMDDCPCYIYPGRCTNIVEGDK